MYRVKSGKEIKEIEESVKERKKLRKVGKITDAQRKRGKESEDRWKENRCLEKTMQRK